ncbi:MAG TPA: T9SS type A sorting domain-containing protein [Chitinophagaceae bacterium]|nr:T9SS type A sorting domain-containing protein [Chitinophagaceae bacterium]
MKHSFAKRTIACAAFYTGCLLNTPGTAQSVLFDFDNAPQYTSLPISLTVNSITAHFSATGQGFSIQDAGVLGFTPQGFSGRVIYPNSIYLADLLVKFDTPLTDFSIIYSCQELGCDDAATMRVTAYMNGSPVGTSTQVARNPGTWPTDTLKCSFTQGFDSVVVHYDKKPPTCQDYGVIFMADNMRVTAKALLPVSLVYFTCEASKNTAILRWKAAEEINLAEYVVEYADNNGNFRDVVNIPPLGVNSNYSFVHHNVNNMGYYRLKMINIDGSVQYSDIKKLVFNIAPLVTIGPNPASAYITIHGGNAIDIKTVQLLSVKGEIVKTIRGYNSEQKIIVSGLAKGTYIVRAFSAKGEVVIEKLFLKI